MDRLVTIEPLCTTEEIQKTKYVTPQFYTVGETQKLINGLIIWDRPDTDWQPYKKEF